MARKELNVKIKFDSETGELRLAQQELKDFGNTANETSVKTEKFADTLKKVAAYAVAGLGLYKLTSSFASLTKAIIQTNAQFERFAIVLETIDGSAKKAQKDLAWITNFAKTTPYEIDQVTAAFVKLKAYGFDAQKDLRVLGDTAAAMGKDCG